VPAFVLQSLTVSDSSARHAGHYAGVIITLYQTAGSVPNIDSSTGFEPHRLAGSATLCCTLYSLACIALQSDEELLLLEAVEIYGG